MCPGLAPQPRGCRLPALPSAGPEGHTMLPTAAGHPRKTHAAGTDPIGAAFPAGPPPHPPLFQEGNAFSSQSRENRLVPLKEALCIGGCLLYRMQPAICKLTRESRCAPGQPGRASLSSPAPGSCDLGISEHHLRLPKGRASKLDTRQGGAQSGAAGSGPPRGALPPAPLPPARA